MNISAFFSGQKILKQISELSQLQENVVYVDLNKNNFQIVRKLSDIYDDSAKEIENYFDCIECRKSLESDYCYANMTSVVHIYNTPFTTNQHEVLVWLFQLGFRSETMKLLEKQDAHKIENPGEYKPEYKQVFDFIHGTPDGITQEKTHQILREYFGKFGDVYFFGHGERVFIQQFLLAQKKATVW